MNLDYQHFIEIIQNYAYKVVLALIILFIGLKLISLFTKVIEKKLKAAQIDESLRLFIHSLVGWGLKVFVFVAAIDTAGVETTSFIALLGTIGLAVGLALQGSLSNFAGGVLILLLKPFKVGDYIEAQGFSGTVEIITAFNTVLKTPDNKEIILPNGSLANSAVVNVNAKDTRRVDFVFGVSYDDDISKVKKSLESLVLSDQRILKEPAYAINLSAFADSTVNISLKVWVKTSDYWGVFFDINEKVKLEFDQQKISFPYPQRDVHLIK
ncbi:MAG: mechanosensitive ion channel [Bacteriovoracaceae bacterium]|nr:mechanosensitive ion channel [Bacteriovoracaceae bacterium]|tara:strand:+ start:245 stop:1048 length:804 start_codon:yes stop_codon:yes gene_type:complete